ncbi:MAG: acyl-CoA thioesterase [Bacteroidetes bacterium]|nr:acyl-CoA thioesterase [Bacteroidota bacterium]
MELHELLSSYSHKIKIQIRFKDIDKQGHVNNANHITYFEMGRVDYFKEVLRKKNNWIKTGMILAKTEITYKRPILLEDEVYCYTKITRFGTKSFDAETVLTIENNGEKQLCAFGKCTLVCMNYEANETVEVPKEWIEAVEAFEK